MWIDDNKTFSQPVTDVNDRMLSDKDDDYRDTKDLDRDLKKIYCQNCVESQGVSRAF